MKRLKLKDVCQVKCVNTDLVAEVAQILPNESILEEASILFSALSDQSRLKILYALSNTPELCVCDIAALLNVKVASASHHLRKLRDLKILKYRNDGKLAYYSLRDQRLASILHHSLQEIVP
ncbi:ArsR/SmtB family transcription factor [Crocosphaera chwakensis]|uniref:Cadmium efflux system accessory protein n=1 Tax=Crocosphaera chwakensis CCY0110 TaxID=391612 RepID=A3IS01_9CHRO|nr:metalloregulator ArsR/SmtB family transcription factor [Crocosphaera chwakensis]EAZ90679.1 cadmium efflux system accessory protein [Crocosphaera chwakensis CCY0110]